MPFYNRVRMTVPTTGTGSPLTLGSAVDGHRSFDAAGVEEAVTHRMVIEDGLAWEIIEGVYTASGTTITRTTLESSAGGTTPLTLSGNAEVYFAPVAQSMLAPATDAELRGSTAGNKALIAALLSSAAAYVTLTDAATVAVDWATFINGVATLTANRTLGNPTNEVIGQVRAILVKGDSATERTLAFGSEYKGDLPTVIVTSTKWIELSIKCHAGDHYSVAGMTVLKP